MISNIIVGIMCVIALAAGIFAWRMEKGGPSREDEKKEGNEGTGEGEGARNEPSSHS